MKEIYLFVYRGTYRPNTIYSEWAGFKNKLTKYFEIDLWKHIILKYINQQVTVPCAIHGFMKILCSLSQELNAFNMIKIELRVYNHFDNVRKTWYKNGVRYRGWGVIRSAQIFLDPGYVYNPYIPVLEWKHLNSMSLNHSIKDACFYQWEVNSKFERFRRIRVYWWKFIISMFTNLSKKVLGVIRGLVMVRVASLIGLRFGKWKSINLRFIYQQQIQGRYVIDLLMGVLIYFLNSVGLRLDNESLLRWGFYFRHFKQATYLPLYRRDLSNRN